MPTDTTKQIASAIMMIAIIAVILSTFFGIATDFAGAQTDEVRYPTTDTFEDLDNDIRIESGTEAVATLGNGVYFDGTDSIGGSAGSANYTAVNWSLAVAARLDTAEADAQNDTRVVTSFANGSVELTYNQSTYEIYYDNGTHNATVSVPANNPGADYRYLVARYNGTHLHLRKNSTVATPQPLTTTAPNDPTPQDWYGSIDELRTWNTTISDSQANSYTTDPISPIATEDALARYMFDEGEGSETFVYYLNQSVSVGGTDWTDGIPDPGLTESTDYELSADPPQVKVLSGGFVEDAPTIYVQSTAGPFGSILGTLQNIGSAALVIVTLSVLVLAGARVMGVMEEF